MSLFLKNNINLLDRLKRKIGLLRYLSNIPHRLIFLLKVPSNYIKILNIIKKEKKLNRKVIAISLTRRIGDIIACEPISRNIRKNNPNAFIVWFTEKQYAPLLAYNPDIDLVFAVLCVSEWALYSKHANFDMICDFHFQGKECCFLSLNKNNGNKYINHNNYYDYGNLLKVFSLVSGFEPIDNQPRFYNDEKYINIVNKLNLPSYFITVHNESGSNQRNWTIEKWNRLVNHIIKRYKVFVVEIGLRSELSIIDNKMYLNLSNKLSILSTAEVIKRSSIFIGLDSGPSHIANAVGTKGIILMGDYYHFTNYQPFSGGYNNESEVEIIRCRGNVSFIDYKLVKEKVNYHIKNQINI